MYFLRPLNPSGHRVLLFVVFLGSVAWPAAVVPARPQDATGVDGASEALPVKVPDLPPVVLNVRNSVTWEALHGIRAPEEAGEGLVLDLGDPTLEGVIYSGPYPFDEGRSNYDIARYRAARPLREGRGTIALAPLFHAVFDANGWSGEGSGPFTAAYRVELYRSRPGAAGSRCIGFYDGVAGFRRPAADRYVPALTITEGPFVTRISSDDPSTAVIAFRTDRPALGAVEVVRRDAEEKAVVFIEGEPGVRHEIALRNLRPKTAYGYRVHCRDGKEECETGSYVFHTAPSPGTGEVRFAFVSDTREGVGGGERAFAGHNAWCLRRLTAHAFHGGAEFFLVGGDLVNGYTSDPADFRLQLRQWKGSMTGFWRTRPVYTAMGNHEALVRWFKKSPHLYVALDRWPYAAESAEAIFAEECYNFENGPGPTDPRRPTYRENVYTFRWGPVRVIAFNNNYWWTSRELVDACGGAPQGYILEDQLAWIEAVLARAEADPAVKFVILFAQEPVFPCGGHTADAMWWNGDNGVRACTFRAGRAVPERAGILEVRNRLWRALSACSKTAAVLAGDEHAYHRLLVDGKTPVGVYPLDDTDGDGKLDRYSPDPGFVRPLWQLTAGTGGAPYYCQTETPWKPACYVPREGYLLFETAGERIGVTFYDVEGAVLDRVEDLMAERRKGGGPGM